jgi:phage terminase large subunit-like protein
MIFPSVIPDYQKGWGAGGYEVVDKSVPNWSELNATRKDPTFVGLGYSSRAIIGKHPDGLLLLDDINDENNTSSEKELNTVLQILNGTILKTRVDSTWMIAVGTPWVEGDVLDYLEKTGKFAVVNTPVFRDDFTSDIEFRGHGIKLTWPEVKTLEFIEDEYDLDLTPGKVEFYRMMLLDLTKIQQRVFTWQSYRAQDISATWPMTVGCDYAGTMDVQRNKMGDNDYFCLAYVMKNPNGGAIVYDGVRERTTQVQAEEFVKSAQAMFRGHITTVVEGDSKGEEFIQVVRRNPGIKLLPLKTGGRGKAKRLERELQPLLASGMVKISDADTPFLRALRKELSDYPNGKHDDTLDAVYWALRGMPDVLVGGKVFDEELPTGLPRVKKVSPFASLARM